MCLHVEFLEREAGQFEKKTIFRKKRNRIQCRKKVWYTDMLTYNNFYHLLKVCIIIVVIIIVAILVVLVATGTWKGETICHKRNILSVPSCGSFLSDTLVEYGRCLYGDCICECFNSWYNRCCSCCSLDSMTLNKHPLHSQQETRTLSICMTTICDYFVCCVLWCLQHYCSYHHHQVWVARSSPPIQAGLSTAPKPPIELHPLTRWRLGREVELPLYHHRTYHAAHFGVCGVCTGAYSVSLRFEVQI